MLEDSAIFFGIEKFLHYVTEISKIKFEISTAASITPSPIELIGINRQVLA